MGGRPTVFLTYAAEDRSIVDPLSAKLHDCDVGIYFDEWALSPGQSFRDAMMERLNAGDYLVVFLSPAALESVWLREELEPALHKELDQRGITVLPVKIIDCTPPDFLEDEQIIDISGNLDKGMQSVIEKLQSIGKIDFTKIKAAEFEGLVHDLLKSLGFRVWRQPITKDQGYDLLAKHRTRNAFGQIEEETWIVQVKHRRAGSNVQELKGLIGVLATFPEPKHGLFVTSTQITSAAREWLQQFMRNNRVTLLQGTDMKRLLLGRDALVEKYFDRSGPEAVEPAAE